MARPFPPPPYLVAGPLRKEFFLRLPLCKQRFLFARFIFVHFICPRNGINIFTHFCRSVCLQSLRRCLQVYCDRFLFTTLSMVSRDILQHIQSTFSSELKNIQQPWFDVRPLSTNMVKPTKHANMDLHRRTFSQRLIIFGN